MESNKNTGSTLLLTGTIKPFVQVAHNDPEVRLREYKKAIRKYITESSFQTIIFAENSGYQFDSNELQELAEANGKKLILLSFVDSGGNNMGSGEAVLMKRTLEACTFLRDDDVIWKVTGRLWISNINSLCARHTKKSNLFLYSKTYDSMETWCFCARVSDLRKYFLSDETIEAMRQGCIEYAWMDCFRRNKSIEVKSFKSYPNAVGMRSSGQMYTTSGYKRFILNILLRTGHFTAKRTIPPKNREGL